MTENFDCKNTSMKEYCHLSIQEKGDNEHTRIHIFNTYWNEIKSAPYGEILLVKTWNGFILTAKLEKDYSFDEDMNPVDQWVCVNDHHPECWSGGACWESNENEECSDQPKYWVHSPIHKEN